MANLKTKKTAAGAQQYSAPGKTKELKARLNKDLGRVVDDTMTRAAFKEKYGMTVRKAQMMIYGADAAETSKNYSSKDSKASNKITSRMNDYEKTLARDSKAVSGMAYGGMAKKKMGYATGGLACGASNAAERPIKNVKK